MERDIRQRSGQSPLPFVFYKAASLVEVTALKARSLSQLLTAVTIAEELSIFYHLHRRFFLDPEVLPEYPNDFAQWVEEELGNGIMAERLANLNLFRAPNLQEVRREITVMLAEYLTHSGDGRQVPADQAFIFCQPRIIVLPCGCQAVTPQEFLVVLRTVESEAIAYHLFAPKVAPHGRRNDFAAWFDAWGYQDACRAA
jgi:hypothetical protein